MAKFLRKHRVLGEGPEPTNTSICQMLNMVLTMNNFRFNGKDFLQIAGTAMGTRVAPTYANIFMADFEEKFVYSFHKQPLFWGRFIDDIFLVWEHGEDELHRFIDHLNTVHNTIKFTSEFSKKRVSFLDVWTTKNSVGYIETDLYTKPTDSNSYLHYYSAHPGHCKRGIPLGQFLRLRRICSDDEAFLRNSIEKGNHLIRRKYPREIVSKAFKKARDRKKHDLLSNPRDREDKKETNILVTTFNPGSGALKEIVRENWDILGRSCSTRGIYEKGMLTAYRRPNNLRDLLARENWDILGRSCSTRGIYEKGMLTAYHRPKNLRDLLVRAKLPLDKPGRSQTGPCNPCNTKNCRYCPRINKLGRIKCTETGRTYVAKHNVTCKSSNFVYCLTCKCCGMQYVGQTKNRLMDRFQAHF